MPIRMPAMDSNLPKQKANRDDGIMIGDTLS